MAGSRKNFGYEADNGTVYGVNKDESKAESTSGGVTLFQPFTAGLPNLPCGLKKRYVNAVLSTDSNIKARFEIGRATVFATLTSGSQIVEASGGLMTGGTWNITGKVGEVMRLLAAGDTGQTDGDNP